MYLHLFQSGSLSRRLRVKQRAFTLVELMVAVALVLLLILGINEVFRLTSQTVGAGQSLSTALRDQRAVRSILSEDFNNVAPDAPAFIITNQAITAFRDSQDRLASVDPTDPRKIDLNGDGDATDPGEVASPAVLGRRSYRIDSVTFFVRTPARRSTGNLESNSTTGGEPSEFLGNSTAAESMVSYGHLRLPDNSLSKWFDPGQPNDPSGTVNDNNRYATQWMLGRRQTLMVPFVPRPQNAGEPVETAWMPTTSSGGINAKLNLTPLSMATGTQMTSSGSATLATLNGQNASGGVLANPTTTANQYYAFRTSDSAYPRVWNSRIDLAITTIGDFSRRLADYERDVRAVPATNYADSGGTTINNGLWYIPANPLPVSQSPTGDNYSRTTARARQTLVYRTEVNPFGTRADASSTDTGKLVTTLSQTAPVLIPRCTNFIVEYAGDFLTQDNRPFIDADGDGILDSGEDNPNYGLVTAAAPDGEIDYILDSRTGTKRIRFYGLPRYTGSGNVDGTNTPDSYVGPLVAGRTPNKTIGSVIYGDNRHLADVVPLSDLIMGLPQYNGAVLLYSNNYSPTNRGSTSIPPVNLVAPFEKVVMTNLVNQAGTDPYWAIVNNSSVSTSTGAPTNTNPTSPNSFLPRLDNYANPSASAPGPFGFNRANYICAWSGGGPKMIRITITLEDPASRTGGAAQSYEYVFSLPY